MSALEHYDELFEQNVRLNTIGSGYATHGGGTISYSAAKHLLVGLTHALAYQVPRLITVNCLCPGWTNTEVLSWCGPKGPAPGGRQAEVHTVHGRIIEREELVPWTSSSPRPPARRSPVR